MKLHSIFSRTQLGLCLLLSVSAGCSSQANDKSGSGSDSGSSLLNDRDSGGLDPAKTGDLDAGSRNSGNKDAGKGEPGGPNATGGDVGRSDAGRGDAGNSAVGDAGILGSRASCKRGVAYGHHSKADLAALKSAVSWWYNWATIPDQDLRDGSYRMDNVEYVPMIWGGSFDVAGAISEIPQDAAWLLGFNEPNFGSQSNLSAADAAALWPQVEEIADALGLSLVSPAVNFCGGACQDTDPFNYLDDFFAACAGCRVDAIAFHIYVGCNSTGANKAEWLINHVETYKQRFSQPLWLTEFACTDAASFNDQIAFLKDAVDYLENEPRIERYSWFSGRFDGIPFVDLLGNSGELTPLGQAYVEVPAASSCVQ